MPPKNKSKRKSQGKRKSSHQGSSQTSQTTSPSTKPASPTNTAETSTTATSTTVEQELITPGALDLRLSNPNAGLAAVSEDSSGLVTPTASDVLSDSTSPDPRSDDVEYQEDDGMRTPTAEMPQSTMTGAAAAASTASKAATTEQATETPAASSYASGGTEVPIASSPETQIPRNPFTDRHSESTAEPRSAPQSPRHTNAQVAEEQAFDKGTDFDEVPLGPNGGGPGPSDTGPAPTPAPLSAPPRALTADEVPTLRALGTVDSVGSTMAGPSKPHETANPFASPAARVDEDPLKEYRSHMGEQQQIPHEPIMQTDAAPDSGPTDGFVADGGANQPATEERQNLWAPGQQGFERSTHVPSTTGAVGRNAVAAPSNDFVVDDSSEDLEDDEPDFSQEGRTGLWQGHFIPSSPYSDEPQSRRLTPTDGVVPDIPPPRSYPFSSGATAAARDDNQSPKSLLPSDPNLPLPASFEPHANSIAPLGADSVSNIRESIELPDLPQENLDGFLNPWTRSQQQLAKPKPARYDPALEEAAISTPDLPTMKTPDPFYRTESANSGGSLRSNEPLMPAKSLFAKRHLTKISNAQLRNARPSVMKPRGPNPNPSKYIPDGTSSGRSTPQNPRAPPPPAVVDEDFEPVRLDPEPVFSNSRYRNSSLNTPAPLFMRTRNQYRGRWDRISGMPVLNKIAAIVGIVLVIAVLIGLAVGLTRRGGDNASESSTVMRPGFSTKRAAWEPKPGDTWQIQTRNRLKDQSVLDEKNLERNPTGAKVFDIDLFQNDKALINELHANGTKVICYFSAGTAEIWRPDATGFPPAAQGLGRVNHMGTRWLDIRDGTVQSTMRRRIDLAAQKGCDGIDPDNVDGYQWPKEGTGIDLTEDDAAAYVKMLAEYAHSKKIAIGLRKSPELAARLMDDVDFSVCESCERTQNCEAYRRFIDAGKPVFHVEYVRNTASVLDPTTPTMLLSMCRADGSKDFSTIIKRHNQDEWVIDCAAGKDNAEG